MIYLNGIRLLDDSDLKNTTANENLAYGEALPKTGIDFSKFQGKTTKMVSFASSNDWSYIAFQLNTKFKKGDIVTISATGNLTVNPKNQSKYKVAIFDSGISTCFTTAETNLPTGKHASTTFVLDQPTNADCVALIYCGNAGQSQGNTLTITDFKVERGTIATAYAPSPLDIAMQSDITNLQNQINQLKSKLGG